ncbi:hypothetical protein ACTL6U_06970 [Rhodovibrionaceae bacterium A322]
MKTLLLGSAVILVAAFITASFVRAEEKTQPLSLCLPELAEQGMSCPEPGVVPQQDLSSLPLDTQNNPPKLGDGPINLGPIGAVPKNPGSSIIGDAKQRERQDLLALKQGGLNLGLALDEKRDLTSSQAELEALRSSPLDKGPNLPSAPGEQGLSFNYLMDRQDKADLEVSGQLNLAPGDDLFASLRSREKTTLDADGNKQRPTTFFLGRRMEF